MRVGVAMAAAVLSSISQAGAQDINPAEIDLAAVIECRVDVPTYNTFAFWLVEQRGPAGPLGLRRVEDADDLLDAYLLDHPVKVFGRETRSVVFDGSGPLAVLDGVEPEALEAELRTARTTTFPGGWFRAERLVASEFEHVEGLDEPLRNTVTLQVRKRSSHPNQALAGCSYGFNVD